MILLQNKGVNLKLKKCNFMFYFLNSIITFYFRKIHALLIIHPLYNNNNIIFLVSSRSLTILRTINAFLPNIPQSHTGFMPFRHVLRHNPIGGLFFFFVHNSCHFNHWNCLPELIQRTRHHPFARFYSSEDVCFLYSF